MLQTLPPHDLYKRARQFNLILFSLSIAAAAAHILSLSLSAVSENGGFQGKRKMQQDVPISIPGSIPSRSVCVNQIADVLWLILDCFFLRSFINTRWSEELSPLQAMSILKSTGWSCGRPTRFAPNPSSGKILAPEIPHLFDLFSGFLCVLICDDLVLNLLDRYFLRKLKKVKKSNGQILALNEVSVTYVYICMVSFPKLLGD